MCILDVCVWLERAYDFTKNKIEAKKLLIFDDHFLMPSLFIHSFIYKHTHTQVASLPLLQGHLSSRPAALASSPNIMEVSIYSLPPFPSCPLSPSSPSLSHTHHHHTLTIITHIPL